MNKTRKDKTGGTQLDTAMLMVLPTRESKAAAAFGSIGLNSVNLCQSDSRFPIHLLVHYFG